MTALFRLANIRTKFEYAKLFVAKTGVIAAISKKSVLQKGADILSDQFQPIRLDEVFFGEGDQAAPHLQKPANVEMPARLRYDAMELP